MSFEETVSVQEIYAIAELRNQHSNEITLKILIRASKEIYDNLLRLAKAHSYITNNIKEIKNGKDMIHICERTISNMEAISESMTRRLEAFNEAIQEHKKIEEVSYVLCKNLFQIPFDGPAKEIVENYDSTQSDSSY